MTQMRRMTADQIQIRSAVIRRICVIHVPIGNSYQSETE
jgi:hypothetical protein